MTRVWIFVLALIFGLPTLNVSADVDVGNGLSLLGDFRLRYDLDHNSTTGKDRERPRLRARLGATYTKDDWEMGLRLRTQSSDNNSPHQNLGAAGSAALNPLFGLDRAYAKWSFTSGGWAWIGKNALPVWQQNEAFWDEDAQAEGIALGYKMSDGLTLQGAHTYLNNEGFSDNFFSNDTLSTLQLLYTTDALGVGATTAVTAGHLKDDGAPGFGSKNFYLANLQLKHAVDSIGLLLGGDYLHSTTTVQNNGFVIQGRATHGKMGVRLYHYYIGEGSTPFYSTGGATFYFTEDNFPSTAAAPVGFRGQRVQLDYALNDRMGVDLRLYFLKGLGGPLGIGETQNLNRYQLNFDLKI